MNGSSLKNKQQIENNNYSVKESNVVSIKDFNCSWQDSIQFTKYSFSYDMYVWQISVHL